MGYYTDYTLCCDNEDLLQELKDLSDYQWENDNLLYEVKWYESNKHCREVSSRYPDELFYLEGKGEEQGDHWKCYFKGGKEHMCKAKITFEDFDESKLK